VADSFVVQVTVAAVCEVDEAIVEITDGVLSTVTLIDEVAQLPAASCATAAIVCEPSETDVLFQVMEYGEVVPDAPTFAPSTLNCTPATPTLSNEVAVSVTEAPEREEPAVGEVSVTVGDVVSVAAVLVLQDAVVPAKLVTARM
jgi:hypothetical protein